MASTIILITGKAPQWLSHNPSPNLLSTNITPGATSGIGYATAKVLALASPTNHIILTSRSLPSLLTAQASLTGTPGIQGTISHLLLDVTSHPSILAAASQVRTDFGHLDVLINNAGVGSLGLDLETGFKTCLETNVVGPALVADAFRDLLFKSANPYSIFVSSGERTLPRNAAQVFTRPGYEKVRGSGAYLVSKAALNMLVVLEAGEYGGRGLKVFALSPGFVVSNLRGRSEEARTGWGKAGDPEESGKIVLDIVMGRRDKDVACLVHKDGVHAW